MLKVLLLSLIPARRHGDGYETLALWARDVGTQAKHQQITLLCPITETAAPDSATLSPDIEVRDLADAQHLDILVWQADVVQVPATSGWRQSAPARRLQRLAKRHGKPFVIGVSSNRAKAALLNRKPGPVGLSKALVRYAGIRVAQSYLAKRADGVFVVGEGLTRLFKVSNVHVATASWITESDIYDRPTGPAPAAARICIASRLEAMKGPELGVQAAGLLRRSGIGFDFDILGEGPEEARLRELSARIGADATFRGSLAYPDEFLSYLRTADFVMLTNLSDEQPRLVFDAISQGCIPICPRGPSYEKLGLDDRLLYQRGSAEALAAATTALLLLPAADIEALRLSLRQLAREFTLESMHSRRAEWMARSLHPN